MKNHQFVDVEALVSRSALAETVGAPFSVAAALQLVALRGMEIEIGADSLTYLRLFHSKLLILLHPVLVNFHHRLILSLLYSLCFS